MVGIPTKAWLSVAPFALLISLEENSNEKILVCSQVCAFDFETK